MVQYYRTQPEDLCRENWEALGNAVVEQCAKDYLHALKVLKGWSTAVLRGKTFSASQRTRMRSHVYAVAECENFFAQYCKRYTLIDGTYIRNKLVEASGMNEELIKELIENFKKEDNYESKTGIGV